jgi:GTP cyclohydrolase II
MPRTMPAATIHTQLTMPCGSPTDTPQPRVCSPSRLAAGREHLAFGLGDRAGAFTAAAHRGPAPLVQPHSEYLTADLFGSQRCDYGLRMREAVERIADAAQVAAAVVVPPQTPLTDTMTLTPAP